MTKRAAGFLHLPVNIITAGRPAYTGTGEKEGVPAGTPKNLKREV
ncbi:hypothetical protein MTY_1693 [Moorella thermoacetica Y72]|uniref:Uncharacterized protein n=1 Tax=Moorella thermoacetica Y72 TaxID=1325331 RepID=A0A0S6UBJ7_NEOTH|nr:hypothetical protein MTY_1693 [Moorella thermoacetica Y72]